jgi:hypothetical protein
MARDSDRILGCSPEGLRRRGPAAGRWGNAQAVTATVTKFIRSFTAGHAGDPGSFRFMISSRRPGPGGPRPAASVCPRRPGRCNQVTVTQPGLRLPFLPQPPGDSGEPGPYSPSSSRPPSESQAPGPGRARGLTASQPQPEAPPESRPGLRP